MWSLAPAVLQLLARPAFRAVPQATLPALLSASIPCTSLIHSGTMCAVAAAAAEPAPFSADSQGSGSASLTAGQDTGFPGLPKLVVFGGRGFVGSHIVQEAVHQGLQVVCISRSGTPPLAKEAWVSQVDWVRGNALEPMTYAHHLQGAVAAISAVGAFGSQEQMLRLNGTANTTAIEAAAVAGVARFVYISAQIPPVPGIELLLRGYVQGKRLSEEALKQHFPTSGVVLRPSVVYGNRVVSHSLTLPLQYLFQPLESLLSHVPSKQLSQVPVLGALTTPPVSVQAVAKAAVRAATDPSVAAGIMDPWEIQTYK